MTDLNIIADALVDVRKAHRLIYSYNRRIFEMIQSINSMLLGFTFDSVDSAYDVELNAWTPSGNEPCFWEAIPAIQLISFWSKQADSGIVSTGDQLFSAVFTADTDWANDEDDVDPSIYPNCAIDSKSEITLCLLRMQRDLPKAKMVKLWYDFDDGDDMKITKGNGGKTLGVTKTINMANINSENDLIAFVDKFIIEANILFA